MVGTGLRGLGWLLIIFDRHIRNEKEAAGLTGTFERSKNPRDIFVALDGAIEISVQFS